MIFGIPVWAVCTVAATFLAIGELFTPGLFFLGPLAVAAVVAALVATTVAGGVGPLLAFVGAAAISVMVLRPLARRHLRLPAISRTGADALVGRRALVLERVDATGGRVKIGGEEWSARPYLEGDALPTGEQVEVAQIDGATALVLR